MALEIANTDRLERLEKEVLEPLTKADLIRIIKELLVKHQPDAIENLLDHRRKISSSPNQKNNQVAAAVSRKKIISESEVKAAAAAAASRKKIISESEVKEAHPMISWKRWESRPRLTQVNILVNTLNVRRGKKYVTGGYGELYTVNTSKCQVSPSGVGGKLHSTSRGSRLLNGAAFGTTVVVDRLVYVLGSDPPPAADFHDSDVEEYEPGDDKGHFHNCASFFDLNNPNDGWRQAPMPKSFDPDPRCTSLKGTIYYFRSTWTGTDPFLEVLDTTSSGTNSWEAIPPPPQLLATYKKLTVSTPVISDLFYNRILVHIKENSSLYAYYPDENKWRCLVVGKFKCWNETVALVGRVIYFHGHGPSSIQAFQAYHLQDQKWLKVVMSSKFEDHSYIITDQYQALINLSGIGTLCLATFEHDFNSSDKTHLTFPKFSVDHSTTEAIVTPISVERMTIQTNCVVVDFLPFEVTMDYDEWFQKGKAKNCKVG